MQSLYARQLTKVYLKNSCCLELYCVMCAPGSGVRLKPFTTIIRINTCRCVAAVSMITRRSFHAHQWYIQKVYQWYIPMVYSKGNFRHQLMCTGQEKDSCSSTLARLLMSAKGFYSVGFFFLCQCLRVIAPGQKCLRF